MKQQQWKNQNKFPIFLEKILKYFFKKCLLINETSSSPMLAVRSILMSEVKEGIASEVQENIIKKICETTTVKKSKQISNLISLKKIVEIFFQKVLTHQ